MDYLENRVQKFNEFQAIISDPRTVQCGNKLILHVDGQDIVPEFYLLGQGGNGSVFGLEHRLLLDKDLKVALKISSRKNKEEIKYNLLFSDIVKKGGIPNFPLFSKCKDLGKVSDENNCECVSCEFTNKIVDAEHGLDSVKKIFNTMPGGRNIPTRDCLVSFSEQVDGDANGYFEYKSKSDADIVMMSNIFSIMSQLIFSLKELHSLNLVHNDTHFGNIFINRLGKTQYLRYTTPNGDYFVKADDLAILADFGLVRPQYPPMLVTAEGRGHVRNTISELIRDIGLPRAEIDRWYRSSLNDVIFFLLFQVIGVQRFEFSLCQSVVFPLAVRLIQLNNSLSAEEQTNYDPLLIFDEIQHIVDKIPIASQVWKATIKRKEPDDFPIRGPYVLSQQQPRVDVRKLAPLRQQQPRIDVRQLDIAPLRRIDVRQLDIAPLRRIDVRQLDIKLAPLRRIDVRQLDIAPLRQQQPRIDVRQLDIKLAPLRQIPRAIQQPKETQKRKSSPKKRKSSPKKCTKVMLKKCKSSSSKKCKALLKKCKSLSKKRAYRK